jgi:CRP/FNR family transcriptional regulator, nitrogen oxide reductase regulator
MDKQLLNNLKQESSLIFKQSPIFATLNEDEVHELSALAKEKRLVQNETIFWEGDASDCFYIVAEGKVKVTKLASTGKEIILSFFGPGEMFGEVAVFENKPYPASAQAISETRLISIKKSDFLDLLMKHPSVSLKIISILSGRLREAQNRLRDLAGERVEQRLARMLLMLAARLGSTLPFTRQELSDMSGTTTETTIRVLSQWKDREIISSIRGKIIITDETKLKLLAEGPPHL